MPDSAPISSFLEAEAKAQELVDELVRLKESVQSYRNAGQALNEVAAAIGDLAERLQGLVEGNGNVLEALRSIGTPELLQRQEDVARLIAHKFDESSAERRALANEQAQRQEELSRLVTQKLAEVEARYEALRNDIVQRQEEAARLMTQKFDEGRAEHGALRRAIEESIRTIESRLARLAKINRVIFVLNIMLVVLLIFILLGGS